MMVDVVLGKEWDDRRLLARKNREAQCGSDAEGRPPERGKTMTATARENEGFVACWNEILTPKWIRFRHLLSGNGKIHSDVALPRFDIRPGDRVLDIGCGFGETCLGVRCRGRI